ncbi:TAR DNA-binding protein 43-like isoform X6 [Littorina saxatilis]|uniref:TAR DNA-binding protein 43-like isoform X6 n=1 Tax=Littorina saxatilis TaxID=31220 RepID=UPI0038B47C61
MSQFIQVCEDVSDEPIEIPSEDDGTLLLTTLSAQFPSASGLKYKAESGAFRGIRLADGVLYPPDGLWGNHQYIAVFPKNQNKRKGEDGFGDSQAAKMKRTTSKVCSDLIVLGLPWKSTEDDLKSYFSQFGELLLVQVKRDTRTGQSKGFGFIRFGEPESQVKCMSQRHMIDGRWCDVTIPNSKDHSSAQRSESDPWQQYWAPQTRNEGQNQMMNRKVFIGRCTEDISTDDLRSYFCKFGEVVDVFIPKPFRAFAFVTFADADIAQSLCGDDHIIKGTSVHISNAAPKSFDKSGGPKANFGGGGGFGQQGGGGGGGFGSQGGLGRGGGPGQGKGNGDGPLPNNLGMNLLNSAMLAAAQAMLSGQSAGWGAMGVPNQQAGATDQQAQGANQGFGSQQAMATQQSTPGNSWWGTDSTTSGAYSGWGSHGGRSGGWN